MKMKSGIFVLLMSLSLLSSAQVSQREIDSMIAALPTITDPKQKVDALNTLAWDIAYIDFKKGITYSMRAARLAKRIKYHKGLVKSYNTLGATYTDMGIYDEALDNFQNALQLVKQHKEIERFRGVVLFNMSRIYSFRKDSKRALTYSREAYRILMQKKDSSAMVMIGSTLAEIYAELGQEDSAAFYFDQAVRVGEKSKDPYKHGVARMQNAVHLITLKKYDEALVEMKIAEDIMRSIDNGYDLFSIYSDYGTIAFRTGKYEEAVNHFRTALKEYGGNTTLSAQRDAWEQLTGCYRKLGRFNEAFDAQSQYIHLSDSINSESNKNQVAALEVKFMTEKSQLQLARLKAQNSLQESVIEKKQLYIWFGVAGCCAFLVVALLFFRSYKNKKKDNITISLQKQLVEAKNKEILDSISYAKRIQNAILPSEESLKQLPGETFIVYQPKDIVAGDFYWTDRVNDLIMFAVCDCTGHGVPGALVSVVCHNALNRSIREYGLTDTGKILDKTRELVVEQFQKSSDHVKDGMDISLCAYNPSTRTLKWSGANIPLWVLRNGQSEMEEYKPTKQPIGYVDNPVSFGSNEVKVEAGDTLYLFSDGYADQFGGEGGKKLKAANLKKMLTEIGRKSLQEQKDELISRFTQWKGNNEQIDDVCVIGIRI